MPMPFELNHVRPCGRCYRPAIIHWRCPVCTHLVNACILHADYALRIMERHAAGQHDEDLTPHDDFH